jgi:MFS family permease
MLRDRSFRSLWLAGLISDTGDWLLLVSMPIVVYEYTGSTLGTATAFLVELIPPVLLSPLAARLANRFDRRRTLIVISIAQAVGLAPLVLVHGHAGLPLLYGVIALESALASLFDPAKNALLPTLVEPARLVSANSMVGLGQNVGRLVGGSFGGLLLALGGGLTTIACVDAVSFLGSAALIASLAVSARRREVHAPVTGSSSSSWSAVLAIKPVRTGLIVLLIASVAQGLFVVLFVVFVARSLHGDSSEIGLLRGVQAVGAIAGGLVLARTGRVGAGRLTAWAAVALGLLDLAIWNAAGLTTAEPLYVALFIAAGAPGIAFASGLTSAMQLATRERQRGTAFAAMGAAGAIGQALGMLAGGLLGDRLGVVELLNIQGALYLAAGAIGVGSLLLDHKLRKPVYVARVIEPEGRG